MLAAVLTTLFFALSATSGQRISFLLGSLRGNFYRLLISCLVLGAIVFIFSPESLHPQTFSWYAISGLIGFGLGDVALYLAYERIGSRMTILLTFCLAPLFAAVTEWAWLGTTIPKVQMAIAAVILLGVGIVVCSRSPVGSLHRRGNPLAGVIFGIIAGFGQGAGAVISRRAQQVELEIGVPVGAISEAFQRVIPGLVVAWLAAMVWKRMRPDFHPQVGPNARVRRNLVFWLIAAALFGPVIGVSFFQQALDTMPSGLVLSVVAITPIVMIPLAWYFEKDRPTVLAVIGGLIAVAGVIALHWIGTAPDEILEISKG